MSGPAPAVADWIDRLAAWNRALVASCGQGDGGPGHPPRDLPEPMRADWEHARERLRGEVEERGLGDLRVDSHFLPAASWPAGGPGEAWHIALVERYRLGYRQGRLHLAQEEIRHHLLLVSREGRGWQLLDWQRLWDDPTDPPYPDPPDATTPGPGEPASAPAGAAAPAGSPRQRARGKGPWARAIRYDRRAVVAYARRWWDGYNPRFRAFIGNDCTHFISQCLWAGGAPMTRPGDRLRGWWYQGNGGPQDRWSLSWTTAHGLRWYLGTAVSGLRGEPRETARSLAIGDVISYDWEGDGRWDHSAVVVARDARGEPLVSHHTPATLRRFWRYRESRRFDPGRTRYLFWHIPDRF